jgi:hypothetical protein
MIGSETRGEELRGWLVPPPSITALALVLAPFFYLLKYNNTTVLLQYLS